MTEALKDTGTITVTGNYSTIPESHGGKKYRGAAIGGTMGYSYRRRWSNLRRRGPASSPSTRSGSRMTAARRSIG